MLSKAYKNLAKWLRDAQSSAWSKLYFEFLLMDKPLIKKTFLTRLPA